MYRIEHELYCNITAARLRLKLFDKTAIWDRITRFGLTDLEHDISVPALVIMHNWAASEDAVLPVANL